jgi:hypothetical protein
MLLAGLGSRCLQLLLNLSCGSLLPLLLLLLLLQVLLLQAGVRRLL